MPAELLDTEGRAVIYSSIGFHASQVATDIIRAMRAITQLSAAIDRHREAGDTRNVEWCKARLKEWEARRVALTDGRIVDRGPGAP